MINKSFILLYMKEHSAYNDNQAPKQTTTHSPGYQIEKCTKDPVSKPNVAVYFMTGSGLGSQLNNMLIHQLY